MKFLIHRSARRTGRNHNNLFDVRVLLAILFALCVALQSLTLIVHLGGTKDVWNRLLLKRGEIMNRMILSFEKATRDATLPTIHVFQYGPPRTATTTQFNMVCVSLFLHVQFYYPELLKNTICNMGGKAMGTTADAKFFYNVPQAVKSHIEKPEPKHFKKDTVVFTTDYTKEGAVRKERDLISHGFNVGIVQDLETLAEVGINGMLKQYAEFFWLTPAHSELMTTYFEQWDKLRQCCGMQMSKKFRNELVPASQKVNGTKPHEFCGSLDMDSLEAEFTKSDLYKTLNGYELMKRINRPAMVDGDLDGTYCSRYNDAIRKHGNAGKINGLNSMYAEVKSNWKEGSKNPFELLGSGK
ncbi:hypothetical protein ACHAW6_002554 [Cyclotella cf. meneghiniana]